QAAQTDLRGAELTKCLPKCRPAQTVALNEYVGEGGRVTRALGRIDQVEVDIQVVVQLLDPHLLPVLHRIGPQIPGCRKKTETAAFDRNLKEVPPDVRGNGGVRGRRGHRTAPWVADGPPGRYACTTRETI